METTETFWVWRRSDGYIGCTRGPRPPSTSRDSFEVLVKTSDWNEAYDRLSQRDSDPVHVAIVASWNNPT